MSTWQTGMHVFSEDESPRDFDMTFDEFKVWWDERNSNELVSIDNVEWVGRPIRGEFATHKLTLTVKDRA